MNLPAPSNLQAVLGTGNVVSLTWADNSKNESSFDLQQKIDGLAFLPFAKPPKNTTSFAGFVVAVGHNYSYRIRSLQGSHVSPWSNVSTVQALEPIIVYGWVTTPIVSKAYVLQKQRIASSGALNCLVLRINWSPKLTVLWFTDDGAFVTSEIPFPGDSGRIGTAHCAVHGNSFYLLSQGESLELYKVTTYTIAVGANGLPTSLTFVDEFSFGDLESRNGSTLVRNDGSPVAVIDNQGGSGIVYVASRPVGEAWRATSAPVGVWMAGDRAHESSALVNPATGNLEFFQGGDGEQKILCATFTSLDPLVFTASYFGQNDGFLWPAGEIPFVQGASLGDGSTVVAYCNNYLNLIGVGIETRTLLGQTEKTNWSLPVGVCALPSLALFYFFGSSLRENFNGTDGPIADDCSQYAFNPQRRQLVVQSSAGAVSLLIWKSTKSSPSVLDT